ncbi:MAG TPA: Ig-like domain repeat protein [Acidobacteriaceae bacterium]|nr:Ig-like domain repeat protein [Acidobacteriaceae bacterium]
MITRLVRTIAPVVVAFFCLLLSAPSLAQTTSSLVTTRITQPIDENSLVTLKGMVHPLANAANDRGAAPDSMPLNRIQVVFKRSAAQEAALQQLIQEQHTPGSPNYHKWLTPAQFGAEFGPSDQDVGTIEAWLESQGFSVGKLDAGRQVLEMSGSVAQFRSAFHTQIHKYMVNGQIHYANATNPEIPSALAPVFGGFVSLNDFPIKSQAKYLGKATYNVKTGQATPEWTYGTSSGVSFVLAPSDFAVQYDLPSASSGINGAGQTIAIINDSNINVGLVNQFRTLFGLSANPPQVIIDGNDPGVDGINNPDGPNYDSVEAYLDTEWAGAVAPDATIDLVIGADTSLESGLILAAEHAVYSNVAPVMSLSFGACEASLGGSNSFLNELWEQAAAQGITVMVSSGDSGSAGCDNDNTQYYAVDGLAVNGFASTAYDVAVGGTDFYYSDYATGGASVANYWNTTASQNPTVSLKTPVPEQPWNDSQYGLNVINYYTDISGSMATTIAGGGGGASSCATGTVDTSTGSYSACTAGYPKPAWQTGTGVPNDSARDVPDVSLFAADGLNGSYYPICAVDADCQPASGSNLIQISGVGGTSAAAPTFAGIMALINQKYGRQGQADAVLYPLATQFPAAFHDVTVGTNAVPCAYSASANSPNCKSVTNPITVTDPNLGTATEGELSGYAAGAGYDPATGLGSVDANVLINDWNSVVFTSSTVSLTSSTTSLTHGQSVTFSGTVTGSGGSTPTGNVAIETDSTEPGQQAQGYATVSSGSFSLSTSTLPGGTYNVWANYAGDGSNASALSPKIQMTVNPEASGIYFSVNDVATGSGYGPAISPGATNIPYGTQLILSAQVAPSSELSAFESCQTGTSTTCPTFTEPTGTVAFSDNGSAINTAVVNAEGDAEYNAPWAVGSHSVTANYSGDSSYHASTASAITFSITQDTPQVNLYTTVTTQSGALVGGQQTVLTIQVLNSANLTSESNYNLGYSVPVAPPTGTVTISGFPSGVPTSATLASGVDYSTTSAAGIATITIPASTAAGTYNVTVKYSGDSNYAAATTTGSIQIQSVGGVATTTAATLTGSISPTTNVILSGTVTGKSGDAAPSNAGGGILIYAGGYILQQISLNIPSSGDVSSFSAVLNSQSLLQGSNTITVQYLGDNTYAPSSITLTTPLSNPLSDFSMVPNTTIVPVAAGTAATDTIQLASVNGFANLVNFTCSAPSSITCSLSPTSYTFSGGASTMTLTLNASASATDGANNVLITGVDSTGKYVHTLSINADVTGATAPAAGFTLAAAPTITVTPGATTGNTVGVSATPSGGFTGSVALSAAVTSSPSGATSPTVALSPASLNITGVSALSSLMTITSTSSTTAGTYTVTVTGTSGSITETSMVSVIVTATPPNFALSASPTTLTLSPGATSGNTTVLTVAPSGGFTGTVNFSCAVTSSPSGASDLPTCSAPSASVTGTNSAASTLTVTTTAATSGAVQHPLDGFFTASGGAVLAVLVFFGIPARRRSWRALFVVLLFAGIAGFGIGCGSGSSGGGGGGGGGSTGTTSGAYVLTVTATSGSITQTTTVNLTVN